MSLLLLTRLEPSITRFQGNLFTICMKLLQYELLGRMFICLNVVLKCAHLNE